jgi:hypothetical protein
MTRSPSRALFERLSLRYSDPRSVQRLLRGIPYNRERGGETLRSAYEAWRSGRAHCLEAAFLAAAILERRGFPPLVMSLESEDDLDHVVFVFRTPRGWGSVGRSRDEGLHGRAPVFRSLRALAWSYVDPYVDGKGRVTGFGLAKLDDSEAPWRDSPRNVWKAEQFLIDLKHESLRSSDERHRRILEHFRRYGTTPRQPHWW